MLDPAHLAAAGRASVIAPAGFGKTHLIAAAVAVHPEGRQLVLTHTHAGVAAIRKRLTALGVAPARFRLDTIAGWCLRYASAYPGLAGLSDLQPEGDAWREVYTSAARLLKHGVARDIVTASYTGVYVDEYQDCTTEQHEVVMLLAAMLPCRVLGDPLQGIFAFRKDVGVEWKAQVSPNFEALDGLDEPWRWKATNPKLGDWLKGVRASLDAGTGIDLAGTPVSWKALPVDAGEASKLRINVCRSLARNAAQSVVVIVQVPQQRVSFAQRLSSGFSCVEPFELTELFTWAARLDEAAGLAKAVAIIDFGVVCMSGAKSEFSTIRDALADGRVPKVKKNADQLMRIRKACEGSSLGIIEALDAMASTPGVHVHRVELLREMCRALREHAAGGVVSLLDGAHLVRATTRSIGRRLSRCSLGSTYLVKGLEFDHAIVLDADELDARNLYVALTRGSRSLTVFSRQAVLNPKQPKPRAGA